MKNLLRLFSFLLVLFSTMFLNSCIPDDDEDEEVSISIVGTWEELNATDPEIAVFTQSGTGYLEASGIVQEFSYSLQETTLSLFFIGSNIPVIATINIVGDNMTVVPNDGGDIITFRRISTIPRPVPEVPANQAAELVGTWESEEVNTVTGQTENERIAFDGLASDGGGGYIQFNSTSPVSFSYTVADDQIFVTFTEFGVGDTVRYSVDADILTIVSEEGSFTYSRVSNSVLDPREVTTTSTNFVGTWEFNDVSFTEKWIFNSDNSGFINNEGSVLDFTYAVSGNNLNLTLDFGGGTVEAYDWTYEITSNILTIYENGSTLGSLTKISDTPEEKPTFNASDWVGTYTVDENFTDGVNAPSGLTDFFGEVYQVELSLDPDDSSGRQLIVTNSTGFNVFLTNGIIITLDESGSVSFSEASPTIAAFAVMTIEASSYDADLFTIRCDGPLGDFGPYQFTFIKQ